MKETIEKNERKMNEEITTTNQCKTKLNDIQCSLFITYENDALRYLISYIGLQKTKIKNDS